MCCTICAIFSNKRTLGDLCRKIITLVLLRFINILILVNIICKCHAKCVFSTTRLSAVYVVFPACTISLHLLCYIRNLQFNCTRLLSTFEHLNRLFLCFILSFPLINQAYTMHPCRHSLQNRHSGFCQDKSLFTLFLQERKNIG